MSPNDNAGRIDKYTFLTASIILFTISVLTTIARTVIRLRYHKRLFIDDAFLFAAVVCLCASMSLLIRSTSDMYMIEALVMKSPTVEMPPDPIAQWILLNKLNAAYSALSMGSLAMMIYWWIITITTVVVWAFGVVVVFLPCPYFSLRSLQCAQTSELPRAIAFSTTATILDIVTDILIMAIPIRILWQIQMKIDQKLVLGFFFCLSIIMIVASLIRMSRIRTSTDAVDLTWENFWQMVETCIAVTMVSLNAFRTLFVAQRSRKKNSPNEAWYSRNRRMGFRKRVIDVEHEPMVLPDIPRATITGMGTFIAGSRSETESIAMTGEVSFDKTNSRRASEGNIKVQPEL